MDKKKIKQKGYDTGRNGLHFWTTDYTLFQAMEKIILEPEKETTK